MGRLAARRRGVIRFCLFTLTAMGGCSPPSQQDLKTAQALSELGESFNDLRLQQQELQDQVDSLRAVLVQRDSVIRTLANLAGVQLSPR